MLKNIAKSAILMRNIHLGSVNRLREVVVSKNDKVTVIEGKFKPSPREPYLIKKDLKIEDNSCILCRLNLNIKHTDVLILHQFITSEGDMLPRKMTGLCKNQYHRIRQLVAMAQEAGLLGNFSTFLGKVDVSNRTGYKQYNTYYDESRIKPFKKRKNEAYKIM